MRRIVTAIVIVCVCLAAVCAGAEAPDISGMSREELIELRERIDARMEELGREEAIANADRKISFQEAEVILFLREATVQHAEIERLKDDAPWRTVLTWSSSDPETATVDKSGRVVAVSCGDAVITAAIEDNPYISGSYTVHVAVPVDTITIGGQQDVILLRGEGEEATTELGVDIEPEDAYFQDVTWKSSDEETATVDANGVVHGLKPGHAVITATSTETPGARRPQKQASYNITIEQAVTAIEAEESEITLFSGEKAAIAVTVLPENAANRKVNYTSDNEETATVDAAGNITALQPGECNIRIEAADGSGTYATIRVTVLRKVTGIRLGQESIRLARGETRTIEATAEPEDASNKTLIWTSSNMMVARVANGTVEAVGCGECEITCTAADGSGVSAAIQVQVPMISVPEDSYTISEKTGILIPVKAGTSGITIKIMNEPTHYTAQWTENKEIAILPLVAGEETLILGNPEDEKDTIQIRITIEDSAVYNQNSYPPIAYNELLLEPDKYEGTQISVYGRVLTSEQDEEGNALLMVGTGGKDYSDQVIGIKCGKELQAEGIGTETPATFYGIYRAQKLYSEALGSEYTMPGMEAEKIVTEAPAADKAE